VAAAAGGVTLALRASGRRIKRCGSGAADDKILFLGVGGMQDLPCGSAADGGYGGGFINNSSDIFIGVNKLLGGIEDGVGSWKSDFRDWGAAGIASRGHAGDSKPFFSLRGLYCVTTGACGVTARYRIPAN
jgi:hypothetical protein